MQIALDPARASLAAATMRAREAARAVCRLGVSDRAARQLGKGGQPRLGVSRPLRCLISLAGG
jgi:hypothetical protein